MISKKMVDYVKGSSAIRAMFEEGSNMAKKYGPENVYDFSLGNPSVSAPKEVNQAIQNIVAEEDSLMVHGYNKSNSGYEDVRETIANHLNKEHGTEFTHKNILMTAGAASGLNVALKTLLNPGDQIIVFAPYFVEYRNYVANYEGELQVVKANTEDFQPNLEDFQKVITEKTKGVILNSPNNPTGVIYSESMILKITGILKKKEEEYGHEIYIISDEPYRELVYNGKVVPYVTNYYSNTIVAYSWSKSLSLPGERIGYLVFPSELSNFEETIGAANIANRILGFVNAPSLMQRVVGRCIDCKADMDSYDRNRKALYGGLKEIGYECIKPEGAFYLFVKSPLMDEKEFCQLGKRYHILMVPGTSFGCPGYVRLAYCVSYDTIMRSLPKFKLLWEEIEK